MYLKVNYPQFKDIKLWHRHGWDGEKIFQELGQFISDPANADMRYLESQIHYLDGPGIGGIAASMTDCPSCNCWVEVAVLYTEN